MSLFETVYRRIIKSQSTVSIAEGSNGRFYRMNVNDGKGSSADIEFFDGKPKRIHTHGKNGSYEILPGDDKPRRINR